MGLAARKLRTAATGGGGLSYADEVLADTPAGYWKLDETSGTTAADSSGNGYDMTYNGSPTLNQSGPFGSAAILTSGTSDASIADTAGLDTIDTGTLECWVKRSDTGGTAGLVCVGANAMYLRLDGSGNLQGLKSQVALIVTSTVGISDTTTWHHVAYTKSGATSKLYLDGSDVTGSVSDATCVDAGHPKSIGSQYNGGSATERRATYIAHAAIYLTALSGTRIADHFAAGA